jgi:hypothetical protein
MKKTTLIIKDKDDISILTEDKDFSCLSKASYDDIKKEWERYKENKRKKTNEN